jgi:hypothetical protein
VSTFGYTHVHYDPGAHESPDVAGPGHEVTWYVVKRLRELGKVPAAHVDADLDALREVLRHIGAGARMDDAALWRISDRLTPQQRLAVSSVGVPARRPACNRQPHKMQHRTCTLQHIACSMQPGTPSRVQHRTQTTYEVQHACDGNLATRAACST